MPKRIPYKIVSEQLQSKLQTMHHNYEILKEEVTVLKEKLDNYKPYIDIINKYDIHDVNIFEHKLKKTNEIGFQDNNNENEEQQIYKLNIKNNVDIESNIIDNIKINSKDNKNNEMFKNELDIQKQKYENKLKIIKEEKDKTINSLTKQLDGIQNNEDNNKNKKIGIDPFPGNIEKLKNDASQFKNKDNLKYSNIVIERIKKFYNNYKEDKFKINFNNVEIDNIKDSINNNYDTININKSKIIYNSYLLYKKYLETKKENNDLLFVDFISENKDINRYSEKAKRCYEFFNELLNITKDIKGHQIYSKINIILDILAKCRLSLDKLYKIRNDNYNELINFLRPIIIKECQKI